MIEVINLIVLGFTLCISVYQIYILKYYQDANDISYFSIFIGNMNMLFALGAMLANLYLEENITNILIIVQNCLILFSCFIYFVYFSKMFYPRRKTIVVFFITMYTLVVIFLIYFTFPILYYTHVSPYILCVVYGSISLALTSIELIPQIVTSLRKGTENIPKKLLFIQLLAVLSYLIYLIVIEIPWYIFSPFILYSFQQFLLLCICIFQKCRIKKRNSEFEEL